MSSVTPQEILNTVYRHLHTQGVRAVGDDGDCLYRGLNNTKCAVGCLIPDEDYDPVIEGVSLNNIVDRAYLKFSFNVEERTLKKVLEKLGLWEHRELLRELQRLHDFWDGNLDELSDRILHLAKKHGLKTPTLASPSA